jgi:NtrC-family two-component system sensor histidine kinase KinB
LLLESVTEALGRVRSLAEDLRELAAVEGGEPLRLERVAPADLLTRVVELHRGAARAKGVEVTSDPAPGAPDVRADATRIESALSTLLAYALERTPPGGRVLVGAEPVGSFVQFSVADNGPEIPVERQAGIFDPLGGPAGRDDEGLELAIVRQVVRAHGGLVWVDSGPGPGCIFSFTLPAVEAAEPQPPSSSASR